MPSNLAKVAGLSAGSALLAISFPYVVKLSTPLLSLVPDLQIPDYAFPIPFLKTAETETEPPPFVCDSSHSYKTELVSLDPLVVYIHSLLTPVETASLLSTAEPLFAPSEVIKHGRELRTKDRTSSSAGLPGNDPAVECVLARARRFMGTMMREGWDEMGPAQLVRYSAAGQRFNLHHDWYDSPRQSVGTGDTRMWNRVASFFAILQDNCTGGETHFPFVEGAAPESPWGEEIWGGEVEEGEGRGEDGRSLPLWREHEDGGLAFRPVAGNAIFWVNLHPNGTGDRRTMHAGLPLGDGLKTAMNIWPRRYYR